MIIKVCGMRDADNIRDVAALDIDLMGFIFYPKSPRYVRMIHSRAGIIPDYSRQRLDEATGRKAPSDAGRHKRPATVGVFVDEMPQTIVTRVYNYDLDYVQLHGHESPVLVENLRRTLDPDIHPGVKFIKAIPVAGIADVARYKPFEGKVDLFLFDTKTPARGGSGQQFDWSVLDAYDGSTPFLLSGGIGPDDVERVLDFHHPRLAGIDLNSRFETEPGVKDVDRLARFVDAIRSQEPKAKNTKNK